jgi:hypothetical protein
MRTTRTTLGPRFSEGARLTWLALREREWTATDLRARLRGRGEGPPGGGVIDRIMYGDSLPGVSLAAQLEALLKVPAATWARAPSRRFVLDAVKRAEAKRHRAPRMRTRTTSAKRITRSAGAVR